MVFAVTFAMAQNTATTTQTGNQNNATVVQAGSLNDAAVTQTGNLNIGSADQSGTSNVGVVDQLDGNSNLSTLDQDGTSNEAYLTQGMVEEYYDAPYNVSTAMSASFNTISATQSGLTNYVEVVQVGGTAIDNGNQTTVSQDGNNNVAYSYQGWPFGFWGETPVTSALSSLSSTVSITQVSDGNQGAVWQYGGEDNDATIDQEGLNNVARIAQGFIYEDAAYNFSHPVYNTSDNAASITQEGEANTAKLFQLGNGNSFTLTQNGDGNEVGLAVGGLLVARDGYFEQDGDGNIFVGEQNDGAVLDNTSRQTGDDNEIDMEQGENDWAKIIQDGNLNDAFLTQGGGGQNATILQTGDNNMASVTQQNN